MEGVIEEGSRHPIKKPKSDSNKSSSSSSSYRKLIKILKRLRHDAEHMPGKELWYPPSVDDAVSMDTKGLKRSELRIVIKFLRSFLAKRTTWWSMVHTDPIAKTTGWNLDCFWRFGCIVDDMSGRSPRNKHKPLELEEKLRSEGNLSEATELMNDLWGYGVTDDDVSHNIHVHFQLYHNRLNAEAAARERKLRKGSQSSSSSSSSSLRVDVLKKLARLRGGDEMDLVEKNKRKKHKPNYEGGGDRDADIVVVTNKSEATITTPRRRFFKVKPGSIHVRMSRLKPSL